VAKPPGVPTDGGVLSLPRLIIISQMRLGSQFILSTQGIEMSQDRQTDKSTWFSITAFDEEEQRLLSGDVFPQFVKKVFGGLEEAPDTGKVHFQGAVQCRSQQRFSAIKKWLPKSHIEVAISAVALKKYVMKEETAVGEKKEVSNSTPYYDNKSALLMIAKVYNESREELATQQMPERYKDPKEAAFWFCIKKILLVNPHLVGVMCKPDIWRAWLHTDDVWLELDAREDGYSITPILTNEVIDPSASDDD